MASDTANAVIEGQYLTFVIRDQTFGINILNVREIMAYTHVSPVPLVPDFILGIFNLRGTVLSVIDVGRRFEWPKATISRMTCIVVTEIQQESDKILVGLAVDAVTEVITLKPETTMPSPNFGTRIRADFVEHVGKVGQKFIMLLDIARLLDVNEIQQLRDLVDEVK